MLNIIIFGAPGSGKGTQSDFIKDHYRLTHISTGDLLRREIAEGSELGKEVEELISKGHLVPDETIVRIMEQRIETIGESAGIIFDGFPRTVAQAEALDEMLARHEESVTLLLELKVGEEELIKRILERGKISGRADDNETSARERLRVYHSETEPVKNFYAEQGKYVPVKGEGSIEEITRSIIDAVDHFVAKQD